MLKKNKKVMFGNWIEMEMEKFSMVVSCARCGVHSMYIHSMYIHSIFISPYKYGGVVNS